MPAERAPALAYLRVSTERQAGETVTSLADQEKALTALGEKVGATVTQWFRDEGASGATVEARPAFSALLTHCRTHPRSGTAPGYVLVLNASRFGRFDDPDQAAALRYELRRAGWLVRFAESDDTEDTIARSVMRAVGDAQASEYRRNIIRNAARGKRGASELGFWTSREPFGYRRAVVHPLGRERVLAPGQRKASDEKVRLVPHDEEADVMRWAFERFGNGSMTMGQLVEQLQDRAPGRKWSRAVLRVMLTNPAYLGELVAGRRSGALWRQRIWRTDPSSWLRIPDAHPPIVSPELFSSVQRRLALNPPRLRENRVDYKVTGIVTCATCGSPMIGGGTGGHFADGTRNRFYRCSAVGTGRCPGRIGNVSKHLLEDAMIGALAKELRHPTVRAAIKRATEETEQRPEQDRGRRQLSREIERAEARRDRLVAAIADGTMTAEEARTVLESTREAIARLRATSAEEQAIPTPDAAAIARERERVLALALDFPRVARLATGPQLRDLLEPFLAGATFDKNARALTLRVRSVPLSLLASHSPRRVHRQQIREVRVIVRPIRRVAVR